MPLFRRISIHGSPNRPKTVTRAGRFALERGTRKRQPRGTQLAPFQQNRIASMIQPNGLCRGESVVAVVADQRNRPTHMAQSAMSIITPQLSPNNSLTASLRNFLHPPVGPFLRFSTPPSSTPYSRNSRDNNALCHFCHASATILVSHAQHIGRTPRERRNDHSAGKTPVAHAELATPATSLATPGLDINPARMQLGGL